MKYLKSLQLENAKGRVGSIHRAAKKVFLGNSSVKRGPELLASSRRARLRRFYCGPYFFII